LPAPDATHTVAQAIAPESKIVYVDNDPLVLAHARALLTSMPQGECDYVDADLRYPETIVKEAARTLDFTQPAAVILAAVLASSESMLVAWLRQQAPRQVAAVPVTAVTCASRPTSGSGTREPGRCAFRRRVSPGRKRTFSR
jgi:hypothetical protein